MLHIVIITFFFLKKKKANSRINLWQEREREREREWDQEKRRKHKGKERGSRIGRKHKGGKEKKEEKEKKQEEKRRKSDGETTTREEPLFLSPSQSSTSFLSPSSAPLGSCPQSLSVCTPPSSPSSVSTSSPSFLSPSFPSSPDERNYLLIMVSLFFFLSDHLLSSFLIFHFNAILCIISPNLKKSAKYERTDYFA